MPFAPLAGLARPLAGALRRLAARGCRKQKLAHHLHPEKVVPQVLLPTSPSACSLLASPACHPSPPFRAPLALSPASRWVDDCHAAVVCSDPAAARQLLAAAAKAGGTAEYKLRGYADAGSGTRKLAASGAPLGSPLPARYGACCCNPWTGAQVDAGTGTCQVCRAIQSHGASNSVPGTGAGMLIRRPADRPSAPGAQHAQSYCLPSRGPRHPQRWRGG